MCGTGRTDAYAGRILTLLTGNTNVNAFAVASFQFSALRTRRAGTCVLCRSSSRRERPLGKSLASLASCLAQTAAYTLVLVKDHRIVQSGRLVPPLPVLAPEAPDFAACGEPLSSGLQPPKVSTNNDPAVVPARNFLLSICKLTVILHDRFEICRNLFRRAYPLEVKLSLSRRSGFRTLASDSAVMVLSHAAKPSWDDRQALLHPYSHPAFQPFSVLHRR